MISWALDASPWRTSSRRFAIVVTCSRLETPVHVYQNALALNAQRKQRASRNCDEDEVWQEAGGDAGDGTSARRKRHTKPSDVELHEWRTEHAFPACTHMPPNLPWRATLEDQVAAASAYESIRLVQLNGGRFAHLDWHEPDNIPIVIIYPAGKLMEWPDFASGAR